MIPLFLLAYFSIGEKLEYVAKFGFLKLGTMTLEVKDTINYEDVNCYTFFSILTSNPGLQFLFSLHDTIEVYAQTQDLLPLFYEEKLNEGKFHNHSKIDFDQDSLLAIYNDSLRVGLLEESRDLLSFWYYLRTIPLPINDTIKLNIHKSKENYRVNCLVTKKERVQTSIGEFNTILVEPQTEEKGLFSGKGGMQIWYSDDDMRYPVQIKTKMKFGSVLFQLKGVRS